MMLSSYWALSIKKELFQKIWLNQSLDLFSSYCYLPDGSFDLPILNFPVLCHLSNFSILFPQFCWNFHSSIMFFITPTPRTGFILQKPLLVFGSILFMIHSYSIFLSPSEAFKINGLLPKLHSLTSFCLPKKYFPTLSLCVSFLYHMLHSEVQLILVHTGRLLVSRNCCVSC